jgi:predicted transcriptional regulator
MSSGISRKRLKAALAMVGRPQHSLAPELGVSASALSAWLNQTNPAPRDLRQRLEELLKLEPGSLAEP